MRGPEASKSRIWRQMRSTAVGGGANIGNEITVAGVQQRPFKYGQRQIGYRAGILKKFDLIGQNFTALIQADFKVGILGMAFAGQTHVFVTV